MIKLDDNWSIQTDDIYNFTLNYEEKREKAGKEVTSRQEYFYPTLELALKKYLQMALKSNQEGIRTAKEIINKIEEVHDTIKKIQL